MPNLKDTLSEQLKKQDEGACGFAAGVPQGTMEEPRGGRISPLAEQPSTRTETTPAAFCSMHTVPVQRYPTTCTVFCACKSQNNGISYGESATHSLCFLAVFMLAMLFGSHRGLVRVFTLPRIKEVDIRFVFSEGGILYFMLCFFKQCFPSLFFFLSHLF